MALETNYEVLFIGRDDNSFLENYTFDLLQDHGDKSGRIFINLEIQNNQVNAEEIGKLIYETLQRHFFEDMSAEPYERFERALKYVNEVLELAKKEKFSGYIGNLNAIVAAVVGDVLYLTQAGDAEAYLIRKKYLSVVSEGLGDEESGDVFSSIASGQVEKDDFVLFSTTRLLRYVSQTDLAKSVQQKDALESLNEVKDLVSTEVLGRIGLSGVKVGEEVIVEVEDIGKKIDEETKDVLESEGEGEVRKTEHKKGGFMDKVQGLLKKIKPAHHKREHKHTEKKHIRKKGGILHKIGDWFKEHFSGLFNKGFGKDKVLVVLIGVIIILAVGIWIAKDNQIAKAEMERLDGILNNVAENVIEAETKGSYDKEQAQVILDKAYENSMEVLNSGYYRDKAKIYLVKIEEIRDKLDNVERLEMPSVYIDLTEKRSDINALGFVEVNDRVFVFEYNGLYEIVLDQVQDPLTIDDEETVIAATGFDDRGSIVFMTKTGKLIEYREGTVSFMDTDDGAFHKGVDLQDWGNRIYVLDPSGNQVWKYTYKGTRDKFGEAEAYLSGEEDLGKAQSFAIDGSLYVLLSSGEIVKYYAGEKVDFYINNAPFNIFKSPTKVYTSDRLDEVYVLDSKEARVLVFTKDSTTGNLDYKSQYLIDGVGELRDLYVDVDSQKMYLLTAGKVLEVGL
jgi:hypothetical protein